VLSAVVADRTAPGRQLEAELERLGSLALAVPAPHLHLALRVVLGEVDRQDVALEAPLEQLDEVPPLGGLSDASDPSPLVTDEHEMSDHVAAVGGDPLDPELVHHVLGTFGL